MSMKLALFPISACLYKVGIPTPKSERVPRRTHGICMRNRSFRFATVWVRVFGPRYGYPGRDNEFLISTFKLASSLQSYNLKHTILDLQCRHGRDLFISPPLMAAAAAMDFNVLLAVLAREFDRVLREIHCSACYNCWYCQQVYCFMLLR